MIRFNEEYIEKRDELVKALSRQIDNSVLKLLTKDNIVTDYKYNVLSKTSFYQLLKEKVEEYLKFKIGHSNLCLDFNAPSSSDEIKNLKLYLRRHLPAGYLAIFTGINLTRTCIMSGNESLYTHSPEEGKRLDINVPNGQRRTHLAMSLPIEEENNEFLTLTDVYTSFNRVKEMYDLHFKRVMNSTYRLETGKISDENWGETWFAVDDVKLMISEVKLNVETNHVSFYLLLLHNRKTFDQFEQVRNKFKARIGNSSISWEGPDAVCLKVEIPYDSSYNFYQQFHSIADDITSIQSYVVNLKSQRGVL